ncbi:MAG: hypothetical protein RBT25_11605 [Lentisphaeria bacterium]|nr:hypothetical protein [Lentisphaeria bacterium]
MYAGKDAGAPTPLHPIDTSDSSDASDRYVRCVRFVRSIRPIRPIRPIYMPDRHARPRHEATLGKSPPPNPAPCRGAINGLSAL